jgi:hypothetical protein
MLAAIATIVLAVATSAAADIKGKWDGTTALLILDQKVRP